MLQTSFPNSRSSLVAPQRTHPRVIMKRKSSRLVPFMGIWTSSCSILCPSYLQANSEGLMVDSDLVDATSSHYLLWV